MLDRLDHDAHLCDEEDRKEYGKDEERGHHVFGSQLRDSRIQREHILDSPWLTTHLGDDPSSLTGDPR